MEQTHKDTLYGDSGTELTPQNHTQQNMKRRMKTSTLTPPRAPPVGAKATGMQMSRDKECILLDNAVYVHRQAAGWDD